MKKKDGKKWLPVCMCMTVMLLTAALWVQEASAYVKTDKSSYLPNESIEIVYENLPGNAQDWITLVEKGRPDNQYGQWFYTKGAKSGRHTFRGVPEGEYEIRVYFNWPAGGYKVQKRYPVSVRRASQPVSSGFYVRTAKQAYAPQEVIEIEFSGLPGNAQDWITLVEKGRPDNQYGQWFYTKGAKSGRHTFRGVPEGEYEVRVYFNWPAGGYKVQKRLGISVRK